MARSRNSWFSVRETWEEKVAQGFLLTITAPAASFHDDIHDSEHPKKGSRVEKKFIHHNIACIHQTDSHHST